MYYFDLLGNTDVRKKLLVKYEFAAGETPLPRDPYYSGTIGIRYRFSDHFQINSEVHVEIDHSNWGYAYRDATTSQPVLGRRDVKSDYTVIGGTYNFNPLMDLTIRMRHYWSRVNYLALYDVMNDGYWIDRTVEAGHDQNFNTFNFDMFYTWYFLSGSRIILSWKNALGNDVNIDGIVNKTYTRNFTTIFSNPHSNEVALKIVYYIDYLALTKKQFRVKE